MCSYFTLGVEVEYLGGFKVLLYPRSCLGAVPWGHARSSVHTWNTSMKCRGSADGVAAAGSCFVPFSFLVAVLSVCCEPLPCVGRTHQLHGFPAGLV